jgi:hypothetical protein
MEARDGKTKRAGTKWRPYCVISIASTVESGPVQVIDKEQSRHSRATGMDACITHDGFVSAL